jgi:formylglycine-generating enzyme required for sulfatase activity
MMGCSPGDPDCDMFEKPSHKVQITKSFEMGRYEVTQAQWQGVMGSQPSYFKGSDLPVEQVTWGAAQSFLAKLNAFSDGYRYRLPTEAEWEYAARAGTTGPYYGNLDAIAWYYNIGGQTHPVGQKPPNAWGLYDMLGNVWEWCQDWYGSYPSGTVIDPTGPSSGSSRILRGGSWNFPQSYLRVSCRYTRSSPDIGNGERIVGLRCVRER